MWGSSKSCAPSFRTACPGQPLHSKRLPFLRNVITIDSRQKGCYTWEEAMALGDPGAPVEEVQRRPPPMRQARRVQYAVHLRHHRLPQGRYAHPLQRGEQRQGHRRLHGPLHRRQADDPGAHVPLLRHGAGHDRRHDPRHHHVPHPRLLPPEGPGLHQPGADHRLPRGAHHVYCHAGATRTSTRPTSPTCARASWPASPAR